jgi:hypothetical protein
MSSMFDFLIPASLSLVMACTAPVNSAPPAGFLEGHLRIASSKEVDLADGSASSDRPEVYAEYPLIVLASDGKREIARITLDADGSYRTSLPPGDYVLDVQDRVRRHLRAAPKRFAVASRHTVQVDMEIDTGVR